MSALQIVSPKRRPVLFSAAMVLAIGRGDKTQTRREIRPQPSHFNPAGVPRLARPAGTSGVIKCPYGQAGDILWVRESFYAYGRWERRFSDKKKRNQWHFVDMTAECDRAYQYVADRPDIPLARGRSSTPGWYKRPSIHMPQVACRFDLRIVSIRVERLNDINESDAIAEGIAALNNGLWAIYGNRSTNCTYSARVSFCSLWESINGVGSWRANPWVWVIEFEVVKGGAK